VAAIRKYPQPISSGAAISKGKGKVEGIGAKCGEMIDEFLKTGAISKVAEKRAQIS
jgi:DNA polymerase/3'-5' exonuclease PolX